MEQQQDLTVQEQSFQDRVALDTVHNKFLPEAELNNFFCKYGLYGSHQLCYGLLCASLFIKGMTKKQIEELRVFEQDLKTFLNASYLRFRKEHLLVGSLEDNYCPQKDVNELFMVIYLEYRYNRNKEKIVFIKEVEDEVV